MPENLRENKILVTGKKTFVVRTTEINEIQPSKENHQESQIQTQESDKHCYSNVQGDSVEIIETFQNEVIIEASDAVETLNSDTTKEVLPNRTKTDNSDNKRLIKSWIFPALFGANRKSQLNSKPSGDEEAPADQITNNTFQSRTHAVGWFKLSRPAIRDDADDSNYEEIASYGSFVNERPNGPVYNPELHNYFIYHVFRMVLKMLVATNIAFFAVNNFINYPKWMLKYFKVDWPRRHIKKLGSLYMDVATGIYIFVTLAFYCGGPLARHRKNAKVLMIAGMVAVSVFAVSYYVINNFVDIVFSFSTTTVVAAGCLFLARRQYSFTNPLLYLLCIAATLLSLTVLYFFGTMFLKRISYKSGRSKVKLSLLCLYQSLTMIVQIAMVTGHQAITYTRSELYFAAFQLSSAFVQVYITIIEIMGLIEIECE